MADTWPYVEAVSWAAITEFTVTEDHLKLLRHVHLYWDYGEGYGAPAINPKRPYGDSYVERSIAEILDAPDSDWEWDEEGEDFDLTPEARERFTRLHVETMVVLHVTLAAGELRPGRYIRDDVIGWVRVEEESAEPGRGYGPGMARLVCGGAPIVKGASRFLRKWPTATLDRDLSLPPVRRQGPGRSPSAGAGQDPRQALLSQFKGTFHVIRPDGRERGL